MEQNSLQYKTYIRRIIFINSATMNEEVLMMDGNIFLNGTNNVGKSSILKGLTYFQGNSPNNMNYDKGELFIPFYFPDAASYIIQEIHKSDGTLYCLVHYASGGVFVLGSYESLRAFIIDSEGYVTPKKELVKRFREANITFFDTTVERWRNIYYGNKKKIPEGMPFVFCDCGESVINRLVNTLFSKEITGNDICHLIAKSGTESWQKMNLRQLRDETHDYSAKLSDLIINWGTADKPGCVQQAMLTVAACYDQAKENMDTLVRLEKEMSYQYDESQKRQDVIDKQTALLKDQIKKTEDAALQRIKELKEQIKEAEFKIRIWNDFSKKYSKHKEIFSTEVMAEMISKYENIQSVNDKIAILKTEIVEITSSSGLDKDSIIKGLQKEKAEATGNLEKIIRQQSEESRSRSKALSDLRAKESERYIKSNAELNKRKSSTEGNLAKIKAILSLPCKWEYQGIGDILPDSSKEVIDNLRSFFKKKNEEEKNLSRIKEEIKDLNRRREQINEDIEKIKKSNSSKTAGLKEIIENEFGTVLSSFPDSIRNIINRLLTSILQAIEKYFSRETEAALEEGQRNAKKINKDIEILRMSERTSETSISKYAATYSEYSDQLGSILSATEKKLKEDLGCINKDLDSLEKSCRGKEYWDQRETAELADISKKYAPEISRLTAAATSLDSRIADFEKDFEKELHRSLGEMKSQELSRKRNELASYEDILKAVQNFKGKYSAEYEEYKSEKRKYTAKESEYNTCSAKKDAASRELDTINTSLKEEQKEVNKQIESLSSENAEIEKTIREVDMYRENHLIVWFDEKIANTNSLKEIIELWKKTRDAKNQSAKVLKAAVSEGDLCLLNVINSLSSFNLQPFSDFNNETALMQFGHIVKDTIPLRDKYYRTINERINSFQTDIINNCRGIDDEVKYLTYQKNRINKRLKECIKNISAIADLQINISKDPDTIPLVKKMFDFYEFTQQNKIFDNGERTFDTPQDYDIREYYNKLHSLIIEANDSSYKDKEYITLADIIKVEFRSLQNGSDSGWKSSINKTGSDGTGTMAKLLLDISLIDLVRQKSKTPAILNIAIDEIGTMSSENFNEIIKYANSCDFNIICAAPDPKDVSEFDYIYQIYKEDMPNGIPCTRTYLEANNIKDDNDNEDREI